MTTMTTPSPRITWPGRFNEVPKEVFVREDVFEEELGRIFYGPEWHPVAHQCELPKPGDFKTCAVGRVPLLIVRGADARVRTFFNACAHRGNQLETASLGNKREIECPYHRWLFALDGKLEGCPNEKEFSPGFKRDDFPLRQPRTAEYKGLVFVTLSDKTPALEEWLENITSTLSELMLGDGRLKILGYQKVRYTTNWKGYADNDGYHAPLLHRAFRLLNWQGGKGRQFASPVHGHIGFESALSLASNAGVLHDASIIEFKGTDPSKGSRIVSLFPTFVATKHLDVVNLRFANPIDVDHTEVHYAYFAHVDDDADLLRHRIRQSSNLLGPCGLISMEDASIFHRVHIGNRTPGTVAFQKGVKEFDGIGREFLQNDESGNLPRWEYYRSRMGFARELA